MKTLELMISSPKGELIAVLREWEPLQIVAALTTFTAVAQDIELASCAVSLQLDGQELPGETLLAKLETLQGLLPRLETLLSPEGLAASFADSEARKGRTN